MRFIFAEDLAPQVVEAVLDAHQETRKALSRRGWCMTPQIDKKHNVDVWMRFEHLDGAIIWLRFNPSDKKSQITIAIDGADGSARAQFYSLHGFNTLDPDSVVRAIKVAKKLRTKDKTKFGIRWQSTKTPGEYRQGNAKPVKVAG